MLLKFLFLPFLILLSVISSDILLFLLLFLSDLRDIFSYFKIGPTISRIPSSNWKYKVFSTCGSHLPVVCLLYGKGFGVYTASLISSSSRNHAVVSVMYTAVNPMLYPFIYSLWNRHIKCALRIMHSRTL